MMGLEILVGYKIDLREFCQKKYHKFCLNFILLVIAFFIQISSFAIFSQVSSKLF